MQCEPNTWVVGAQISIPIVLAVVGFLFTRAQVEIARNKLKLDHYDKRFAVFDAARNFLAAGLVHSEASIADQNIFLAETVGATFLFNDTKVPLYLEELRKRIVDLPFRLNDVKDARDDEERKVAEAKYLNERRWLRDQYQGIEEVFRPHLQLKA